LPSSARSAPTADLSYCARDVRRYDNDRFLTALFAPAGRREGLFTLLAFNLEIAKTREVVTEPLIGQMRLQWWRDAIDGCYQPPGQRPPAPAHEVARPLAEAIDRHHLPREPFDRLIDARETDLAETPPASLAELVDYAGATGAPVVELGLGVLGLEAWSRDAATAAAEAGRAVGTAWALTGLLRAVPFHARQRRVMLPADLLGRQGLSAGRLIDRRPEPPVLAPVVAEVVAVARAHLDTARRLAHRVPAAALPALLPATLADLYLHRLAAADHDVFAPRVMVRHPLRPLWLAWRAWRRRY
jgi:phytoene synthase